MNQSHVASIPRGYSPPQIVYPKTGILTTEMPAAVPGAATVPAAVAVAAPAAAPEALPAPAAPAAAPN